MVDGYVRIRTGERKPVAAKPVALSGELVINPAAAPVCTLYDFRGVPGQLTEDNPLYGLYRFKKGFNGEYTEFIGEWDLVYRPVVYFLWRRLEHIYSEFVKPLLGRRRR